MHVFMDSWIYGGEGKGFGLSDEMLPPLDPLTRRKEVLTGWELRSSCSYENSILVPGEVMAENHGFMDLGSASTIKKAFSVDSTGGLLDNNSTDGRLATLTVSVPFNQKEAFREVEAGTKDSSSIIDTSAQDSSLIDLKLGRLGDYRDAKNSKLSKDIGTPPSHASHMPAKRIRSTSLNGQTPFCQVLGCNMNLSSSKDYHKRHKVCEVHSKTAKVIVNGIEQRFCQQCSRFHLLTEFDDGKRSCRKRLAGHNERRRKPQLGIHSGRNGKLFHSYHGSGYLGTPLLGRTSFVCPDIFPSGIFREVKYESNNWGKHQKLADDAMYSNPQPSLSVLNGQLVSKPFLSHYGLEKELPSMQCISTASGSISYDSSNHYGHGFNSSSSIFNDGSNIQGVSGVTESGCALSLLSSQSQNSSTYTSTIHVTQPLIFQGGHAQYSTAPFTDKPLLALGSQASTSVASNRFSSSGMNSVEDEQMGLSVSDASNALDFEVQTDGRYQGYRFMDTKDPLFNASGHTIDLLQLSSLLQSAEERRRSMQVKQECEAVSCLPMS